MPVRITNNAYAQIPAAIAVDTTSIDVASGYGGKFPELGEGEWFYATLLSVSGHYEIVKVTSRTSDTLTLERGAEGTTPLEFAANSRIELRVTKGNVDIMNQNVLLL